MLVRLCSALHVLRRAKPEVRAPDGAWGLRAGCSCGSLPRALDAALAPVRLWLRSDAMAALPACANHHFHYFALQVTHLRWLA